MGLSFTQKVICFCVKTKEVDMAKSIKLQILSRIYGRGRGWSFSPNDFKADFKPWEINNSLEDLTNEGKIRRISRGLYDYPMYSNILNKFVTPDMEQVAYALARKFAWRIQPTGETALNYLGLSTQVTGKCLYLSDGPSKKYDILGQQLEFKHNIFREAIISDNNTILVVQAIKAVGENNITKEFKGKMKAKFTHEEWHKIKKSSSKVTGWVYKVISELADKDDNK